MSPILPIGPKSNRLWLLACAAPAFFALWIIFTYSSNIPLGDQWDTPGQFVQHLHNGTESVGNLFGQHNEARKAVTRVIWSFPILWWGWSTKLELLMTWFCVVAISFCLWRLLNQTDELPRTWRGPIFLVMNVLLFGAASWEYWIWSLSLEAYLPTLALLVVLNLCLSAKSDFVFWSVSTVGALIAIFSYPNGLFLVAVFIYCSVLRHFARKGQGSSLTKTIAGCSVFLALMLGTVLYYFNDFYNNPGHPGTLSGLQVPFDTALFWARWHSAALVVSSSLDSSRYGAMVVIATILGPLLLFAFFVVLLASAYRFVLRPVQNKSFALWSPLLVFILMSGLVAASGRVELSERLWSASRYVCFSLFGIVAFLPLAFSLVGRHLETGSRRFVWPSVLALVVFACASIANSTMAMSKLSDEKSRYDHAQAYLSLRNVGFTSEWYLPKLYTATHHYFDRIDWFLEHGYIDLVPISLPPENRVREESFGDVESFTRSVEGMFSIRGWAEYNETSFVLLVGREKTGAVVYRYCYPHENLVREVQGTSGDLRTSGFAFDFKAQGVGSDLEWDVLLWDYRTNRLRLISSEVRPSLSE